MLAIVEREVAPGPLYGPSTGDPRLLTVAWREIFALCLEAEESAALTASGGH
jgi:hypothetical protein